MKIANDYNIGQKVYLVTDPDQYERLVTGIIIRPAGLILYEVVCGTEESTHNEFELSDEKRII